MSRKGTYVDQGLNPLLSVKRLEKTVTEDTPKEDPKGGKLTGENRGFWSQVNFSKRGFRRRGRKEGFEIWHKKEKKKKKKKKGQGEQKEGEKPSFLPGLLILMGGRGWAMV